MGYQNELGKALREIYPLSKNKHARGTRMGNKTRRMGNRTGETNKTMSTSKEKSYNKRLIDATRSSDVRGNASSYIRYPRRGNKRKAIPRIQTTRSYIPEDPL